jgi:anti-sigma-K factor RskA
MSCDQLREHYELYALGVAEEPERGEIREHLQRGCEVCGAGVKRALETAALLGASAPPARPSPQLRRRILASVGVEPRRASWFLVWAMAAALAVMFLFLRFIIQDRGKYVEEAIRSRAAFSILFGPNTSEVSFGGQQPRPPNGKVFVSASRGVLLFASNLPRTPADRIYQMWIIPKGAKPVPAGLFQSQEDGNAMHVRPGMVDLASTAAVAVTIENRAGADQPTTTPLIVAPLANP